MSLPLLVEAGPDPASTADAAAVAAPALSAADELSAERAENRQASRGHVRESASRPAVGVAHVVQRKARPPVAGPRSVAPRVEVAAAPKAKPAVRGHRSAPPRAARKTVKHRVQRAAPAWSGQASSRAGTVIAFARAQLGEPYVLGAAGPGRWDCSGLTMKAYARVGVGLPHKAARQDERGRRVSRGQARPGDLVLWGGDQAHHVGIYLGGGRVIHAPKPGDRVKVSSLWGSHYFVRVL